MNIVLQSQVWQFERLGYFVLDSVDSSPAHWIFNRVVALKDNLPLTIKNNTSHSSSSTRKAEQEKQLIEKLAKSSLDPKDMFRYQTNIYSRFDPAGLPTHDSEGKVLSKNALKKLKKEYAKQKKVFEKHH